MINLSMRTVFTAFFFCWVVHTFTGAQEIEHGNNGSQGLGQIEREHVFIHYNTSLLLTGEYVYYRIYVLNENKHALSNLSKIAYVVLMNENGDKVFHHKTMLRNGLGQGDYFIPVTVPPGNYKLIGYTRWMTNLGEESFFSGDVVIVNPYTNDQEALQSKSLRDPLGSLTISDSVTYTLDPTHEIHQDNEENIRIVLNHKTFSKREKVVVDIDSDDRDMLSGNYSLSVRKRYSFNSTRMPTSKKFQHLESKKSNSDFFNVKSLRLPEIRGSLFIGKLNSLKEGVSIRNKKVVFSIPGEQYELKLLTTDQDGHFAFSLDEHLGETGLLQVLDEEQNDYSIDLNNDYPINYDSFEFNKFSLHPEVKSLLRSRSIYNQIENAYFTAKPDTVKLNEKKLPFYGLPEVIYDLDDFTRFKTFEETAVEILDDVWLAKDGDEGSKIMIRVYNGSQSATEYPSLVIVDGIFIQNIQPLLDFDARKIKSIKLLRKNYVLGSQIFNGIIDIETFKNDFSEHSSISNLEKVNLSTPLPTKDYYKQVYTEKTMAKFKNIPDYRQQLLWQPSLKLPFENNTIDFFTSDVSGEFEIVLEGFTAKGESVSIKSYFSVE